MSLLMMRVPISITPTRLFLIKKMANITLRQGISSRLKFCTRLKSNYGPSLADEFDGNMIRKREPDFGISGQKQINGIVYDGSIIHGLFSVQIPCKIVPCLYTKKNKNVITNQCLYSCKMALPSLLLTKISAIMISQKDHIKYIKMQYSERRCIEKNFTWYIR